MKTEGLVAVVMRGIERGLLDGTFGPNTRLPSERALAEQYKVSRNTVREAVQRLRARGLVRSRQGAGVFVSDLLRTGTASPWSQLVEDHPALRDDILEFRRVLEGATAFFAAQRCTDEDKQTITALRAELATARSSNDRAAEAVADARLHEAIALASHNTMFLHLHTSVLSLLREHITLSGNGLRAVDDAVSQQLLLQHDALCDAILGGRPEQARTAMQEHIDYVRTSLDATPA